ncbi:hypothetical protein LRP88_02201 [Fusarium phalaenopsidis]
MSRTTTALVVPELNGQFELQEISLDALQSDEALVQVHAFGVCHTDISCAKGKLPCGPNAVLGHEGAGVVLDVGSAITSVMKGDKVLMSFSHCESCPWCVSGQPAYCCNFNNRNFGGKRPDGSSAMFSTAAGQKKNLFSSFFGQSSFARHTVVHQSCLVRVAPETPLNLFAPLGCGIQTGVGAVLNTLRVKPGSSVAVFGVGAVGMAAVMAAKFCQAKTIIVIDLHPGRLELATQLGATHSILGSDQRVVDKIQEICPPVGVDYAVDCTGVPAVVEKMVAALGTKGRAATVGAPGSNSHAKMDIMSHLTYGKEYVGCSEGDSNPSKFIPYLIDLHSQGLLPLERLITYYSIQDYEKAIADVVGGLAIKAVILWNEKPIEL